ncbi:MULTISPECIES: DUF7019 family protein [unclassified Streptomyces]|uniref:DUF7019 family protein n=1 Tax=unclassified Streptomyces TaxID=2593676 RepID=UPI000B881157|nr:SAVMC3_10250 family protein [Streptomyces sp. DvalAA-14]MYS19241.1 hypothetical protein [Streptomyces sp. SID4948]
MSLRYYLYVSDAKVDMMLAQIDPKWERKRVTEFSFGLKMLGARHSVESAGTERIARLERVVRHLEDHGDLGGVDEPGQYVRGVLPMQWGPVGDSGIVYFGGRSDRTIVGLGGSAGHVLGAQQAGSPAQHRMSGSVTPTMLVHLAALLEEPVVPDALATVVKANAVLRGPAQSIEFVARRLLYGPCPYPELYPVGDMAVLLGSPLYVALAE